MRKEKNDGQLEGTSNGLIVDVDHKRYQNLFCFQRAWDFRPYVGLVQY
jgi:hypothetical protein